MPRYIDADALISAIKNELWDWNTLDDIKATSVLQQTITDIQNMPTADVVEVVRCKECVNCTHLNDEWWCGADEVLPEGFCSNGERRTDEEPT